jgi:hypothetical protein
LRLNAPYFSYLSDPLFQIDSHDLDASRAVQREPKAPVRTVTWFWSHAGRHLQFGGPYTIFRLAEGLMNRGIVSRFVVSDSPWTAAEELKDQLAEHFPALAGCDVTLFDRRQDSVSALPATDAAICTNWQSAYLGLRFNQTRRKYYLIQDYEPLFAPAGPTSALIESTYRFGMLGIVNTPGLFEVVNQRHGVEGMAFVPAVDRTVFHPPAEPRRSARLRVYFYARANNTPRNAFELGVLVMRHLLARHDERIELVVAGSDWNPREYGLHDGITNVGLLPTIREVGELYRSCDIGFVYMLSRHPSYQPFEFMASGMATVSNYNESNLWFLKNEENCLLAEPSPVAMAEKIGLLIEDDHLRRRIATAGLQSVSSDWDGVFEHVASFLNEGA